MLEVWKCSYVSWFSAIATCKHHALYIKLLLYWLHTVLHGIATTVVQNLLANGGVGCVYWITYLSFIQLHMYHRVDLRVSRFHPLKQHHSINKEILSELLSADRLMFNFRNTETTSTNFFPVSDYLIRVVYI